MSLSCIIIPRYSEILYEIRILTTQRVFVANMKAISLDFINIFDVRKLAS